MDLLERDLFLESLQSKFDAVRKDGGHCVFINGEAGLGKTSLVKVFCERIADGAAVYRVIVMPCSQAHGAYSGCCHAIAGRGVETKFNFADRTNFQQSFPGTGFHS